jgi:endonuclease/exonuclease/phosphatase family metal-dependent hydrolase
MRVLSWNLYHGRDRPPDPALLTWRSRLWRVTEQNATHAQVNRSLLDEFTVVLGQIAWDLALLQEAPPRWFERLGERTGSNGAIALTSRNLFPPLQHRLADANPDLLASWEGGSNQLLVRAPGDIVEVRRLTLTHGPERRRMLWARLELPEGRVCIANLHATAGLPRKAAAEVDVAAARAVAWSGGDPLVFGGDLNLRPRSELEAFARLNDRFGLDGPCEPDAIDHLLVRDLDVIDPTRRLPAADREVPGPGGRRIRLSDHAPVVAAFETRHAPGFA